MPLALYLDHHVRREVTGALRRRGVDVLTCREDGTAEWADATLLDRATQLGRVLVSQDADLLAEAVRRQREGGALPASSTPTSSGCRWGG